MKTMLIFSVTALMIMAQITVSGAAMVDIIDFELSALEMRTTFGSPTVNNGQIELYNPSGGYEQVKFTVGNRGYDQYIVSFTATAKDIASWQDYTDAARVFLDVPAVATTNWMNDRVYHRNFADPLMIIDELPHSFSYFLDFSGETDWLKIVIDGNMAYDGILINSEGDLRSVRLHTNGQNAHMLFDDFKVQGGNTVPVPAAVWLFGSGLFGLIAIRRKK